MSTPSNQGEGRGGSLVATDLERAMGALGSRMAGVAAAAGIVLAVAALGGWLEARADRARLQATLDSQGTLIAAAQRREQDRAQELAETLKQIAALKQSVQTPQQVIREIPQFLPQLPQAITPIPTATAPGRERGASEGSAAPSAAAKTGNGEVPGAQDVRVPAADLKPLFDYVQDCRACQAKLSSAQQDLKDEQAKNSALTTQRDAAVKAAKGGGVWTRTWRAMKWAAVGFAVGYLAHAKGL